MPNTRKCGIIFYTDNEIKEPIGKIVKDYIFKSRLPIVSCSLKPIDFGTNVLIKGKRGYITMVRQIIHALRHSKEEYVFFCEHDCLYPESHFEFVPPRNDIFYYNENVWRWWVGSDTAIRYDRMLPLSCMCSNRELALEHYKMRLRKIKELGAKEFKSREPRLARIWGYEPGTKKRKRGGLTDDDFNTWSSDSPVIDIRHRGTFSPPKNTLASFKHEPKNWEEVAINKIKGWNLKKLFKKYYAV